MTGQAAALDAPDVVAGTSPWRRRLGALLAIASVAEAIGILVLSASGDPRFHLEADLITLGFVTTPVVFPVMGALILQRRPRTRVAWLMVALGLGVGSVLFAYGYGVVGYPPGPHAPLPFALLALVVSQLFFVPAIVGATTWILLLYPTDHLLSPRWRFAGWFAAVLAVVYVAATLFSPGPIDSENLPGLLNPLGLPGDAGATMRLVAQLANAVAVAGPALGALSLIVRYRRADLVVRAQIRWLALVTVVAVVALGLSLLPLPEQLNDLLFGLGLTLIALMPIAIGIAITRYRLYEIDRLINRALVYGSLTAILAGIFTAGVGLAQRMFVAVTHETSDAAVVGATLVVATLYAPLRKRLEAVVDRRFKFEQARFGAYREDLVKALTISQPKRAAGRLAREVVAELELVGAAVLDGSDGVVASAGVWPSQPVIRVPIRHRGEILHVLALGPRRDGERPDPQAVADVEALADLVATAART
jgi:hypothetical protein